jgi:hypothetical protein
LSIGRATFETGAASERRPGADRLGRAFPAAGLERVAMMIFPTLVRWRKQASWR